MIAIKELDMPSLNISLTEELKLTRLKEALKSGIEQAESGNFAHYSLENMMQELDQK